MAELAFDDAERALDFGPNHGNDVIGLHVKGMQRSAFWRFSHDTPDLARLSERGLARDVSIAPVGPDRGFRAVQQVVPDMRLGTQPQPSLSFPRPHLRHRRCHLDLPQHPARH